MTSRSHWEGHHETDVEATHFCEFHCSLGAGRVGRARAGNALYQRYPSGSGAR